LRASGSSSSTRSTIPVADSQAEDLEKTVKPQLVDVALDG
jgi:hypothetical protein